MAIIRFTSQLQRFTRTPEISTAAVTLRDALEACFGDNPALRGYILDDQGHLRTHVAVFIDGRMSHDRIRLNDPLQASSEVYVMQALSGG